MGFLLNILPLSVFSHPPFSTALPAAGYLFSPASFLTRSPPLHALRRHRRGAICFFRPRYTYDLISFMTDLPFYPYLAGSLFTHDSRPPDRLDCQSRLSEILLLLFELSYCSLSSVYGIIPHHPPTASPCSLCSILAPVTFGFPSFLWQPVCPRSIQCHCTSRFCTVRCSFARPALTFS